MRNLLAPALVVCLFAAPVMAGDVNTPGKTEPPPCTTNCSATTTETPTTSSTDTLTYLLLQLALSLVAR